MNNQSLILHVFKWQAKFMFRVFGVFIYKCFKYTIGTSEKVFKNLINTKYANFFLKNYN
jgi:hypothetical protein